MPREEGGVVDCYRPNYLHHEARQGRGRLGQLPSWEDEVQCLARWKASSKRNNIIKFGLVYSWKARRGGGLVTCLSSFS